MSAFTHAISTNNYGPARYVVATSAANGTHTTLASALSAASSGDTVFLRDSVTENVTIPAGINIAAWYGSSLNTPTITGTVTMSGSGTSSITGIRLVTNSAAAVTVSGASSILNLQNCFILASNNVAITQSNGTLNLYYCNGDISGANGFFAITGGTLNFNFTNITNTASSTTQNTCANGSLNFQNSAFYGPITTSGTTGNINAFASYFFGVSVIALTQNSTTGTEMSCRECFFFSNAAEGVTVGASAQITLSNCTIRAHQANAITGAGSIKTAGLVFEDLGTSISTTTVTNLVQFPAAATGNLILISSKTASASASIAFTSGITGTYNNYLLIYSNMVSANNATTFELQLSTNGGSSYIATGYNVDNSTQNETTYIPLTQSANLSNSTTLTSSGFLYMQNMTSGTTPTFNGQTTYYNNSGPTVGTIYGWGPTTTTVNAFKVFLSAGNISTGTFTLYGILE